MVDFSKDKLVGSQKIVTLIIEEQKPGMYITILDFLMHKIPVLLSILASTNYLLLYSMISNSSFFVMTLFRYRNPRILFVFFVS